MPPKRHGSGWRRTAYGHVYVRKVSSSRPSAMVDPYRLDEVGDRGRDRVVEDRVRLRSTVRTSGTVVPRQ